MITTIFSNYKKKDILKLQIDEASAKLVALKGEAGVLNMCK